jgi:hypothetical protein
MSEDCADGFSRAFSFFLVLPWSSHAWQQSILGLATNRFRTNQCPCWVDCGGSGPARGYGHTGGMESKILTQTSDMGACAAGRFLVGGMFR